MVGRVVGEGLRYDGVSIIYSLQPQIEMATDRLPEQSPMRVDKSTLLFTTIIKGTLV